MTIPHPKPLPELRIISVFEMILALFHILSRFTLAV